MQAKRRFGGNRPVLVMILFLTAVTAIFARLNAGDLDFKKELELQAEFLLSTKESTERVQLAELLALQLEHFHANLKTNQAQPREVKLSGVALKSILAHYQIPLTSDSTVQISSLDGYTTVLKGEEVLAEENVYLTIAMDDQVLKTKSEGGFGPYLLVIRHDPFSQRWVKFVQEISVFEGGR